MLDGLRQSLARVWNLVRGGRLDRELDAEVGHHLESLEAEHRARGLSPEAARLAARRDFGGVSRIRGRRIATSAVSTRCSRPWGGMCGSACGRWGARRR